MTPDRRSFLLGSAAAAVSARTAAAQAAEIRTAFVGVGARGGGLLKQVLAQQNVKVTGICDIDSHTLDQALTAASRDNPRSFTEWRRLLDLKEVDAVFIATPCDLHAEMASAFLEAGKHVYLEKPLAITPEGVDRVVRAAQRSRAHLQIGQQLRYFPALREAIRRIHDGQLLGQRYAIKAQRHSSPSRPGAAAREPTPQQKVRAAWYADVKRSGDLIVENAVHNLDACNWIADSRPASAYSHGKKYRPQPMPPGTVMMDGFSVEYIYENGMHLDYSQFTFHPRPLKALPSGQWYAVFGEKGAVWLTHTSAAFHDLYGEGEPRDMLPAKAGGPGQGDTAVSEFYASIRENRRPFADIRVAAVAALTAIMGREAIYKGRSVTWKELGVEV